MYIGDDSLAKHIELPIEDSILDVK